MSGNEQPEDVYGMQHQNIDVVVDDHARAAADERDTESFNVEKTGKASLFSGWHKMSDGGAAAHEKPKSNKRCERVTIVILALLALIFMITTIVLACGAGPGSAAAGKQQKIAAALILSSHMAPGNTAEARALAKALEISKDMGETDLIMAPLSQTVTALAKSSYWPFDIRGFQGRVEAVDFSPDGRLLAAGSADETIKITPIVMDRHQLLPTPVKTTTLDCNDLVDVVAWSPSGNYLAAACNGVDSKGNTHGRVKVWSVQIPVDAIENGKYDLMFEMEHTERVQSIAWSHNSTYLAAGDNAGHLKAYFIGEAVSNDKEPRMVELLDIDSDIRALAFSPDSEHLAVGTTANMVMLMDVTDITAAEIIANGTQHRGDVNTVAFSPNGYLLVSGSSDGTMFAYDMRHIREELVVKHTLPPHETSVRAVAFGSDSKLASTGYDSAVRVYEVVRPTHSDERIRLMDTLRQPNVKFSSLSFVDGEVPMIAAGTRSEHAMVWRAAKDLGIRGPQFFQLECSSELDRKFGQDEFEVRAASWNEDSTLFAASSVQGYVCIWESARPGDDVWKLVAALEVPGASDRSVPVRSLSISPDSTMVAAGTDREGVHVWKSVEGRWELFREHFEHSNDVNALAWSPDSQFLASGSEDKLVIVWPVLVEGSDPTILHAHGDDVNSVAFFDARDDEFLLASGSSDQTVRLYWIAKSDGRGVVDVVREDKIVGLASGVQHVVWSSEGRLAVSGNEGVVTIYERVRGHGAPDLEATLESRSGVVFDLSWSPKGDRLAAAMSDATVHIWYPTRGSAEMYDDWTMNEKCENVRWMAGTHDRLACDRPSKVANGILPRDDDPAYNHFMQFLLVDLREMEALMDQFAYGELDRKDIAALGYGDVESVALSN